MAWWHPLIPPIAPAETDTLVIAFDSTSNVVATSGQIRLRPTQYENPFNFAVTPRSPAARWESPAGRPDFGLHYSGRRSRMARAQISFARCKRAGKTPTQRRVRMMAARR